MNIFLWVLQVILALHTIMGAMWKVSNPEQSVSSLQSIPHGIWLALSVLEVFTGLGLILPAFKKSWGRLAPIAALCIALEMLIFSALHLTSGISGHGEMTYWLVVAAVCGFVAYGRLVLKPFKTKKSK